MDSGMYVFGGGQTTGVGATYYVDPVDGSDVNSGNSPDSPMQTVQAAAAKTKIGDEVLLRRGTRFFTRLELNYPYRRFGTYGHGVKPVVDGSVLVAGPWTQHSTYTNVWYADVTFDLATTGDYAGAKSGAWHPALWDESETDTNATATVLRRLRDDEGVSASASQDQILTIVNSQPNTFCVFRQGSSNAEPRLGSENSTDWRVYFHPRDESDPNENGRMVRIAEDRRVLVVGAGQQWHDIVIQRSGSKDSVGSHSGGSPEIYRNCEFLEGGCHGVLGGGAAFENCRVVSHKGHTDGVSHSGGGIHQYRGESVSRGFEIKDCYVEGFGHAIYSHGGPDIQHEHCRINGLTAVNCHNVFQVTSMRGVQARSIVARNCANLANVPLHIEDSDIHISGHICGFNDASSEEVTLKNCFVYGCSYLLFPVNASAFNDINNVPTLVLENTTVYSSTAPASSNFSQVRRQFHVTMRDSIIAGFYLATGTVTLDANSVYRHSLTAALDPAETQRMGHLQVVEMTITEDDVIWVNNNNRQATYSGTDNGDGTANITLNVNTRQNGTWIKIPNGNGAGQDYQGRILSNGPTTSDPIVVSPPPGVAFSGVVFQIPMFKYYLHRDPVTGTLSADGLQIKVPDGRIFYPGNAIRVGNVGPKRFGLRYITAVEGNVITLDRPCLWKVLSDNLQYNSLDGTTVTARRHLPQVEVLFGFPILKRNNSSLTYPRITVTTPGGDVISQIQQASNNSGSFTHWSSSPIPALGTHFNPEGTARVNPAYNGGIQHELGYFDLGLAGMGIGDTVRFEFQVFIEEEQIRFNIDPAWCHKYVPSSDSLSFSRNIGYRG